MNIQYGRLYTETPVRPVREKPRTRPATPEPAPDKPADTPEGLPDPGVTRPDEFQPVPMPEPLFLPCFGRKLDRQA